MEYSPTGHLATDCWTLGPVIVVFMDTDSRSVSDRRQVADPPSKPSVVERLRSRLNSLSPAEQLVARFLLANPLDVMHQSVTEVAVAAGSSVGSVVRCCQSIGLKGFHDLKLAIASDSNAIAAHLVDGVLPDDQPHQILMKVFGETAGRVPDSV